MRNGFGVAMVVINVGWLLNPRGLCFWRAGRFCRRGASYRAEAGVQVGFFFWPFSPELVTRMAEAAEHYGYDMIGIADTPGNAMDPWVAMTLAAQSVHRPRIALCVSNLATRHPATSAAAIASIDLIAPGRAVLGIGTGHSSPQNLGIPVSSAGDLEEGLQFFARSSDRDPGILSGRHGPPALGRPAVTRIPRRFRAEGARACRPRCRRRLHQFRLAERKYWALRGSGRNQCPRVRT
jgi:hypothetical protein